MSATLTVAKIIGADHGINYDLRDAEYLARAVAMREQRSGPRVGDYFQWPDGEYGRFTHHYDDSLQTTVKSDPNRKGYDFGLGSHHLTSEGYISYSGALDPSVPKAQLEDTGETRLGTVWFFHHGIGRAHSAVYANIPCRVYRLKVTD